MKNSLSAVLAVALFLLTPLIGLSEEPAERFLAALRDNNYHELALEYLTSLENSDLVSDEFRKSIPFEKAEMLIASVDRIRNMEEWEAKLGEAESLLKAFAASSSEPDVVAKTQLIRGNLFRQRARIYQRQSESDRLTAAEKDDLVSKTQKMLQDASNNYKAAQDVLAGYLRGFQIDPGDPNSEKKLKQLRGTFTQVRFNQPAVLEMLADTYPAGEPRNKQFLEQALREYKAVFDKYRRYRAGLNAGLSAARCEYKLGRFDDALFILEQFFELQNNSETRVLRRKALTLGTQCWEQKDPFPFQEVITVCEPSVRILSKQELRENDWLRVQLVLAKAYRAKAKIVATEQKSGVAAQARRLNSDAVKMAKNVARAPGDTQEPARALLAEWKQKINVAAETETAPETFADARQKGQDVVADVESIVDEINGIKRRPANTDEEKAAKQDELANAKQRLESQTDMALGFFDLAISLKDEQTDREDINRVRYYQSFCYFVTGRYYEAATIGEFLLERYPSLNWTRQTTALAIRSYVQLVAASPDKNNDFEVQRLTSLSDRTLTKWPGSNEASLAARLGAITALENGNFETAISMLEKIPSDYPLRSGLAARLGQKLWFKYQGEKDSVDEAIKKTRIEQSKKYLLEGTAITDLADLSYEKALAALLLIDAHLALGENELALARLESETVAPLDLIKAKHPAIFGSSTADLYVKETYKSAIKAYLAGLKTGKDQQNLVTRVRGVLQALESDAQKSGDPQDKRRLTTIYRMIATELKNQFDEMQSADEKKAFANTIATFLGAIEQNASDAKTVLWAGSTLLATAESLNEDSLTENAKQLFQQAVSALNRAEKIGFNDEANADIYSVELRRQRALAERGAGNYEAAVNQLSELLKESPNRLNIQIDAALTLHMWAKANARAEGYREAMMGRDKFRDPKTRKNTNAIWGWRKIFTATRNNKKFIEQFNLATFHLIESRFEFGVLEKSEKAIASANTELKNAKRRDPTLGGPKWKPKFEDLEKRIQNKLK